MDSVSICNMALGMLGMPSIVSFSDENNNAQLCGRFFPALRDRVLRDHTWSFAHASCMLQALDEEGFDPAFPRVCAIPADLIRIVGIVPDMPFRRQGKRVHVPELPARLIYIRRVEDPTQFDEAFTEALQYLLAAEIGMAHTRDMQLCNNYRQEYERILAVACSIDSQENAAAYQPLPRRSHWLASRGSGVRDDYSRPCKWTEGTEGKQEGY